MPGFQVSDQRVLVVASQIRFDARGLFQRSFRVASDFFGETLGFADRGSWEAEDKCRAASSESESDTAVVICRGHAPHDFRLHSVLQPLRLLESGEDRSVIVDLRSRESDVLKSVERGEGPKSAVVASGSSRIS